MLNSTQSNASPLSAAGYDHIAQLLISAGSDLAYRQQLVNTLNQHSAQLSQVIPTDEALGIRLRASGESKAYIQEQDHRMTPLE